MTTRPKSEMEDLFMATPGSAVLAQLSAQASEVCLWPPLEFFLNRQQAHDANHEPLPQGGLRVFVILYGFPVRLRRPHQIPVRVQRHMIGTAGGDPLIHQLSYLAGNLRTVDHHPNLSFERGRAGVEIKTTNEHRLAVEHQRLSVQRRSRATRQ